MLEPRVGRWVGAKANQNIEYVGILVSVNTASFFCQLYICGRSMKNLAIFFFCMH